MYVKEKRTWEETGEEVWKDRDRWTALVVRLTI
jgi:hypothetical protein